MKAIILAAIVAYVAADCGVPSIKPEIDLGGSKIVGGTEAKAHSWPWQIALFERNGMCQHICGGSLISENWVVTAAHCVFGSDDKPQKFTVKLGAHKKGYGCNRSVFEIKFQQIREVAEIRIHPKYDHNMNSYDVAMLKLSKSANLNSYVNSVCLPQPNEKVADGTKLVVTGWGTETEGTNTNTQKLRQVAIPIVNQDECKKDYKESNIDETMLCAGYKDGGKDSCQGDSGGPLVQKQNEKWVLEGVVSWGEGCAQANYPGIYSRVANPEVLQFIKSTAGVN